MESDELLTRARGSYEGGRLRWALQIGWVVAALVAASSAVAGWSGVTAATGMALLAVTTLFRWRGRTLGAAVGSGLTAGLIPFTLLLTLKCSSHFFCALGGCMAHCARFCAFGGLAAGVLLATRAHQHDEHVVDFLIAGSVVAALTGLLGCFVGGIAGAAWMVVGELVATTPAFALRLRQRSG